jgi:hypothetical protein
LIAGVAGDGEFVGGPFVEIIGRCIARGFALLLLLLRDLATCIGGVFLIMDWAQGSCLVKPFADLLDMLGVFRLSKGVTIRRNFL